MEISRHSKRLLLHAVPVVGLCAIVLALSVVTYNRLSSLDSQDQSQLAKSLVTPFLRAQPTANGLSHISKNDNGSHAKPILDSSQFGQSGKVVNQALTIKLSSESLH